MKRVFPILFISLGFLLLISGITYAQGLVPCGQPGKPRCELGDLFTLVRNIYNFIVLYISTPLAGLIIVIGGILMMISGGPGSPSPITGVASPNLYNTAKNMISGAIFGWFLIWGSWLIIHTLLWALGVAPGFIG